MKRWRAIARDFRRTRRSAVALELAIAAVPFFILFLGTMEVAFDLYVQSAMNSLASQVAIQIWTGQAQQYDTSIGGASFVSTHVCPLITGLLNCGDIQMNIQKVPTTTNFYNYIGTTAPAYVTGSGPSATLNTNTWDVCTGGPSNAVFLQAVYAGPTFIGAFIPSFIVTYNGGYIHPTYATQAWVNQPFTATASC